MNIITLPLCCMILSVLFELANTYIPLKSWHVHEGMTKALSNQIAGYDNITKKIWIFGGHNKSYYDGGLVHTYYEFDITSNRFIEYHNNSIVSSAGSHLYVTINDTIYTYYANHIQFFNMTSQQFINNTNSYLNITKYISNPCMATDGNRYLMIIGGVDMNASKVFNTFYIYDLFEGKYLPNGPSTIRSRSSPACIVGSDNFLYVFGGIINFPGNLATDTIERINITNITNIYGNIQWTELSSTLTETNSQMRVIEHNGYIYIIGGDSNGETSTVDVFNISTLNITVGISLPQPANYFAITGTEKYIYLFGGSMGQNSCVAQWTISNNLLNNGHRQSFFFGLFWNWKGIVIVIVLGVVSVAVTSCIIWKCNSKSRHNSVESDELLNQEALIQK
eukprot:118897_1